MSSRLQQSNTRVMQQKIEKAKRLIEEVKISVEIRGKSHELWEGVLTHTGYTLVNLDHMLGCLEAVVKFNKEAEARKI